MQATVKTAMKMSRVPMRDWAMPRVSVAARTSAASDQPRLSPSLRAMG